MKIITREAHMLFNIYEGTFRRWYQRKHIQAFWLGKTLLFKRSEILNLITACRPNLLAQTIHLKPII